MCAAHAKHTIMLSSGCVRLVSRFFLDVQIKQPQRSQLPGLMANCSFGPGLIPALMGMQPRSRKTDFIFISLYSSLKMYHSA